MNVRDEQKGGICGKNDVGLELFNAEHDPKQLDCKQSHAWFNYDEDGRTKFAPAPDA